MTSLLDHLTAAAVPQHGVLSRDEVMACGAAADDIARLVRSRRLLVVYRGVYRVAGVGAGPWADAMAAVLAAAGSARLDGPVIASHWTAAALWQVGADCAPAAHVIGPRQVRAAQLVVHRVALDPCERTVLRGIPVTTPARTVLDLAAVATTRELEQAHARAERSLRVRRPEIRAAMLRHPRARGSRLLRSLLDELDASGLPPLFLRSQAEEEGLAMVRSADLPRPLTNAPVLGLEVDFLWPDLWLVMEVDGLEFHSSPEAVQRDRHRDRLLVGAGFMVVRFTWRQLTQERDACLATLAGAIGARQQLLAMGALARVGG